MTGVGIFKVQIRISHHIFPVVHDGDAILAALRVVEMHLYAPLSIFP